MQNIPGGEEWKVRQTFLEVNLTRLKKNFKILRRHAKGRDLILVLKSNAYGHSLVESALALDAEGKSLHAFAVANIEEGIALRRARISKPIYILSGVQSWDDSIYRSLQYCKLTPVVSSLAMLKNIASYCEKNRKKIKIHLKFNSGMNRLGLDYGESLRAIELVEASSCIQVEGLLSHFAGAESPRAPRTTKQIAVFRSILDLWKQRLGPPKFIHMENSAGFQFDLLPESNLARIGLHLYGISHPKLKPVARWSAQIYQIRDLKKGDGLGYGPHFVAKKPMRIAILGVGYADGYMRSLSNRADVLVRGTRCKVLGAVSMDLMAIDITHLSKINLKTDRAILLGEDQGDSISAEELARHARTIPWEIMTNISQRVPRKFYL